MDEQLNFKIADALMTMPEMGEYAFSPVHAKSINLPIYVERTGQLPDGGHQVYALDNVKLDVIIRSGKLSVVDTFAYILNVSPLSSRTIWAAVTDIKATPDEPDPIIALHCEDRAQDTMGRTVMHFVNESEMRAFVAKVEAGK